MDAYSKSIAEGTFECRFYEALGFPPMSDEDDTSLVLRITLGDMDLMDGFYISLPVEAASCSIEDAIREYVLCESEADRLGVKQKLARDPNLDLLDIYDSLLWLYEQAETGGVTLSHYINNGASEIPPTDLVSLHKQACTTDDGRSYNLLDLVLEVYDNVDPFSGITDEQKEMMLRDFRGLFILYLMDKFGYQPELQDTEHAAAENLSAMLEHLASEDIGLIGSDGDLFLTPEGHDLLSSIVDEAEFYIDNYDIFGDVYVKGDSDVRFDTEYCENLIAPVFIREGIDPYRAFFVAALYLGNLDHLVSDLAMLFSEEPFRQLFSFIAHSKTVEDIGAELLDRTIQAGKSKVEEKQLREQRLKHIESIERRINSEQ